MSRTCLHAKWRSTYEGVDGTVEFVAGDIEIREARKTGKDVGQRRKMVERQVEILKF